MSFRNPRVAVELAEDYGYGLQVGRGLRRYRVKRPNWLFVRCVANQLVHADPQTLAGAIGHYYSVEQREALRGSGIPYTVSVSSRGSAEWWMRIIPDDYEVGRLAAEYFIKKGYRKFGLSTLGQMSFAVKRGAGFRDRLAEAGLGAPELVRIDNFVPNGPDLPMALFALNDARALSHINRFLDQGIRVPEDVSVLGVDDDELVALYTPVPISSVRLPLERIGFEACEALEGMMEAGQQEYGTCRLSPLDVEERRSTEAFAVSDGRVRKAQAYMESHLTELSGVDALAEQLHLNRRTLERLFERSIGLSPAAWLMRRRAEYAEKLLVETDYTVDHIAELSGFEDRRRLYRAFRKLGRPLPSHLRAGR